MLGCRQPWGIIVLLAAQSVPVLLELRARGRSTRVFGLHALLFIGLLVGVGSCLIPRPRVRWRSMCGVAMLIVGVLVRSGVVPVHCWMTDLFEKAAFGSALLYVVPMAGAYAAVRGGAAHCPRLGLAKHCVMSLLTAVYAAGMALVQTEARRFFCYLFLSNSSLVLVGLQVATPVGLTGGLCVWLSVGVSLAGFGLTLRSLEARTGRISLSDYHGLYEHMPMLAVFFLLTGLASVGFPGTVGFIGTELLIEGAVDVYPHVGMLVVFAAALNSIAVLHAYLRLFTGTVHTASISLRTCARTHRGHHSHGLVARRRIVAAAGSCLALIAQRPKSSRAVWSIRPRRNIPPYCLPPNRPSKQPRGVPYRPSKQPRGVPCSHAPRSAEERVSMFSLHMPPRTTSASSLRV